MSNRIHNMMYIKLPIALAQETLLIVSVSLAVLGH